MIALGFFLNPFINIFLKLPDNEEYNDRPASLVRLIKTFPVLLYLSIKFVAVLRCATLLMLFKEDTVLGIDQSFFLKGQKPSLNFSLVFFLTGTF